MGSIIMVARDVDDLVENSIEDYVNLSQSTSDGQTFEGINFGLITSYMQDAKYTDCLFRECAFPGLHMEHAKFDNSEFVDCRFDLTKLDDASFRNSSFRGGDVYLGSASMTCADFTYSNLASVDLSRAYAPGGHSLQSVISTRRISLDQIFAELISLVLIHVDLTLLVLIFAEPVFVQHYSVELDSMQ